MQIHININIQAVYGVHVAEQCEEKMDSVGEREQERRRKAQGGKC